MRGVDPGSLNPTLDPNARGNLVGAGWIARYGSRAQRRAAARQLKQRATARRAQVGGKQ